MRVYGKNYKEYSAGTQEQALRYFRLGILVFIVGVLDIALLSIFIGFLALSLWNHELSKVMVASAFGFAAIHIIFNQLLVPLALEEGTKLSCLYEEEDYLKGNRG